MRQRDLACIGLIALFSAALLPAPAAARMGGERAAGGATTGACMAPGLGLKDGDGGGSILRASGSAFEAVSMSAAAATGSSGAQPRKKVSRVKSVGASLLLPGLGQLADGHPGRARVYLMAEASILVGFLASEIQGRVQKERYIDYAETFGGVPAGADQPDWFYRNLGNYASYADYRDEIERGARAIYGDDLAGREAYVLENLRGVPEWQWQSQTHRLEFRDRRKASRNAYRRASLFVGGAILNRLISAIDAAWLAGRGQRKGNAGGSGLFYQPGQEGGYVCLRWALGE
ncbi:MAG: hypothetical protein V1774_10975 [Candidatus Eisenbacteria bacterium]